MKTKKILLLMCFIFLLSFPLITKASGILLIDIDYSSVCANEGPRQVAKICGIIVQICKWVVPLIIIILGMFDFAKAVISNDEKAISAATTSLIKRIISGIVVFLIPAIVMGCLKVIKISKGIEDKTNNDFGACTTCIFDYKNCK